MNIYICATYPTFIKPIADRWQQEGHNVVIEKQFNAFHAQTADVLFAEWGDRNALAIQNFDKPNVKKMLRVHSYEVYTDIWRGIDFNIWDEVIFTTRSKAEYLMGRLEVKPTYTVIPSGIKTKELKFSPAKDSKKIAFLGLFCRKKGLGELELIANTFRDYEFHLGGEFQEPDLYEKLSKNKNLIFDGWIKNKSDFFKDKKYVISTSVREGEHISVMEGMACGCKPIIRDWIGSDRVYRKEWIYKDIEDIKTLLEGRYEPKNYRKFIEANYNFERCYNGMKDLL